MLVRGLNMLCAPIEHLLDGDLLHYICLTLALQLHNDIMLV
jgi:hypothetical protein